MNLTALAPEQKQAVRRGWSEGGVARGKEGMELGQSVKQMSRKIHGKKWPPLCCMIIIYFLQR